MMSMVSMVKARRPSAGAGTGGRPGSRVGRAAQASLDHCPQGICWTQDPGGHAGCGPEPAAPSRNSLTPFHTSSV